MISLLKLIGCFTGQDGGTHADVLGLDVVHGPDWGGHQGFAVAGGIETKNSCQSKKAATRYYYIYQF